MAVSDTIEFAGFRVDGRGGAFRLDANGEAVPIAIGSRALEVLSVLASRPGDLVSKREIMDAVWPDTTVEDKNLAMQVSTLRRVLEREGGKGAWIQTVPGRGYRFVVAVKAGEDKLMQHDEAHLNLEVTPVTHSAAPVEAPGRQRNINVALVSMGLLALAALLVAGIRFAGGSHASSAPPRLSVVVLPFQNLSGDRAEDYLADAVTDDLTTDLSRMPGAFVIARQSAYTYQGRTVGVRHVGEELGVRYALRGSVRKLGDVLRVNAQLVATETGEHLWADRFDERLENLSVGQERIARRVGETLNVALLDVESARSRRERPTNPDAFDLIIRARSIGLHVMGRRQHAERLDLYEQALRLDPTSLLAVTGVAGELIRRAINAEVGDDLRRAARLVGDATAINPNHHSVLDVTAFLLFAQRRYPEAISAYQRMLDEYPNADTAYNQIAISLTSVGRAEEAIPMVERAIQRNPRSPYLYSRYETLGYALLMLGRDEEAITWTRRALAAAPADYMASRAHYNLRLAAAYTRLGRLDEARRAVTEANRAWPYDTVRMHWPADPSSPVHVAQIERFQAMLRLAGHRDHAEEDADFGVASDATLHEELAGPTPTTVPGAKTIRTAELAALLAVQYPPRRKPVVIDPMMYSWGRSVPGAVGLRNAGGGSVHSDADQDRLRQKMRDLTSGDLSMPVVAVGWNSERFDGRNLALRLVALGYNDVRWYRGGREAWEVVGLPETEADVQDW